VHRNFYDLTDARGLLRGEDDALVSKIAHRSSVGEGLGLDDWTMMLDFRRG